MAVTQWISSLGRPVVTLALVSLASTQMVEAQVGLTSGMTNVALVARAPARGAIDGVARPHYVQGNGSVREAAVTVRLSANTSYRLMVRSAGATAQSARVWVRNTEGVFQELESGSSVTVAREAQRVGAEEREVRYRVEAPAAIPGDLPAPALQYIIAVDPTI